MTHALSVGVEKEKDLKDLNDQDESFHYELSHG